MKTRMYLTAFAVTLLSTTAMANDLTKDAKDAAHSAKGALVGKPVANLPESGEFTIVGTVTNIDQIDNEFTVQDKNGGSIDVESEKDLTVNKGDKVTVTGTITTDMGEKELAATTITVSEKAADNDEQL